MQDIGPDISAIAGYHAHIYYDPAASRAGFKSASARVTTSTTRSCI